jgi:hypothetical protein
MAFRTRPIVLIVDDDPVIAMTNEDAAIDAGASVGGHSFLVNPRRNG